eukprot:SAG31_NODE_9472_length_1272_cov_1.533674_2_plen_154_part_00
MRRCHCFSHLSRCRDDLHCTELVKAIPSFVCDYQTAWEGAPTPAKNVRVLPLVVSRRLGLVVANSHSAPLPDMVLSEGKPVQIIVADSCCRSIIARGLTRVEGDDSIQPRCVHLGAFTNLCVHQFMRSPIYQSFTANLPKRCSLSSLRSSGRT